MPRLKNLSRLILLAIPAVLLAGFLPGSCFAQEESSSKHPPVEDDGKSKGAATTDPNQPKWDPVRAEKDIEVGNYYMKRHNFDAAIDRFQDAIEAHPNYALPFKLLGEAQEKKGLRAEAIKSYTRYLEINSHADDRERILKRIDHLRIAPEKRKHADS